MTDRELTQRITDYLTGGGLFNPEMANHEAVRDLLIDCREALAQPEQEPVAWITRRTGDGGVVLSGYETCEPTDYDSIPVYTAPPKREWVGLTDDEIQDILDCGRGELIAIKKTEQRLKDKNTT